MKGTMGLLRMAVIGFAAVAGGRALYRSKDKLARSCKKLGGVEGLRGYATDFSVRSLLGSIGPLKDLLGQLNRFK